MKIIHQHMKRNPSINVALVKEKMTDPPKAQRLYSMIYGDTEAMTRKQVKEVIRIVKKEHAKLLVHLEKMAETSRLN